MEAEITEIREKMRKLESGCILSIGKAREEGIEEGMAKGKEGTLVLTLKYSSGLAL